MVEPNWMNPKMNWVCPNDRQLMLRAVIQTGWSTKAERYEKYGNRKRELSKEEQKIITDVIRRAEALDLQEQERVGRLVDRVNNMKRYATGSGTDHCALCGEKLGFFLGASSFICHDCQKAVCSKCGIESMTSKQETIWLCKICTETREIWKKSGAWFYKGLPKYVLPEKSNTLPPNCRRYIPEGSGWVGMSRASSVGKVEKSSSDSNVRRFGSTRARSPGSSPTSPLSDRHRPKGNTLSPDHLANMTGVRESRNFNTNRPTELCKNGLHKGEAFCSDPMSSQIRSLHSGEAIPQIFVNCCNSKVVKNTRDVSESDKVSVSTSGVNSRQMVDEDDGSIVKSGKFKRHGHKWLSRSFLQTKFTASWRKVVSVKNKNCTKNC